MKKMIAILLVLCLVLGGVIGFLTYRNGAPAATAGTESPAATETPAASAAPAETVSEPESLDLAALYATRAPEEVVMVVDGREETWDTYFYFLASQADYVEDFFATMESYYGLELKWSDVAEGDDETYADLAAESVEEALRQFATIEGFARANGVELTEENRQTMAEQLAADMAAVCGEDATEADFEEYLAGLYMSRDMYDRINTVNLLYQETFRQLYGEDGEAMEEAAVLQYLADNEYLSANHILLLTEDPTTGEALDEAAAAEKLATAEKLAEELQAIEDETELLARFAQLKEEYCEDSGKAVYPAGYTFTPGTMVTEFEDACKALENYQVSDPIKSSYGYHVIVKLPLDADALLLGSSGEALTARASAANTEYGQRLQAYLDGMETEYAEGFEVPNLLKYVK